MNSRPMSLHARVLDVMSKNPELLRHKSYIFGSSCRRATGDGALRSRILSFCARYPQWRQVLSAALNPTPPAGCCPGR